MHISYRCAENRINTNRDALVFLLLLLSTYTTFDLFFPSLSFFFFFLPRLLRSFLRIIERCDAEREDESIVVATTQIEFYFVSISFLIGVCECLSLIGWMTMFIPVVKHSRYETKLPLFSFLFFFWKSRTFRNHERVD